jgi:hypothetical protein
MTFGETNGERAAKRPEKWVPPIKKLAMVEVMTRWARLALATVAMILAGAGAPVVERLMTGDASAVESAIAAAPNPPDAVVATRARPRFVTATIRLVPMVVAVELAAGAASIHRRRRGHRGVLCLRLEDAGDRWRALLLGAPPAVL